MEFKRVPVPALDKGILLQMNSVEQLIVNMETEMRLMYVAETQAMERLTMTYPKRPVDQPITVPPMFLAELTK